MRATCGFKVIAFAVATSPAWVAAADNEMERFTGLALSDRGEFAYREVHEVEHREGKAVRSVTRYFDRRDKLIAELVSDYRRSRVAPDYVFLDGDGRVRESSERLAVGLLLRSGGESKVLELDGQERLVIGQGLHQFVRENIEELASGTEQIVHFAIPSRFETFAFRVRAVDPTAANVVRIEIKVESWLLALIAPTLTVDYDRKAKRLLSYSGVSNLEGPDGETQKVVIRYTYESGKPS